MYNLSKELFCKLCSSRNDARRTNFYNLREEKLRMINEMLLHMWLLRVYDDIPRKSKGII